MNLRGFYFLLFIQLFLDNSIDYGDRCQVYNIPRSAFYIYEMDWLVQAHLDRADTFGNTHFEEKLVGHVCRT